MYMKKGIALFLLSFLSTSISVYSQRVDPHPNQNTPIDSIINALVGEWDYVQECGVGISGTYGCFFETDENNPPTSYYVFSEVPGSNDSIAYVIYDADTIKKEGTALLSYTNTFFGPGWNLKSPITNFDEVLNFYVDDTLVFHHNYCADCYSSYLVKREDTTVIGGSSNLVVGEVPVGYVKTDTNITIRSVAYYNGNSSIDTKIDEEVLIDLDCDGEMDLRYWLSKGNPALDWPNSFNLTVLDSMLEVLVDTISNPINEERITWYSENDTINRAVDSAYWASEDEVGVSAHGGFCMPNLCEFNAAFDNKYMVFKKVNAGASEDVFWLKLSVDITENYSVPDSNSISATIHEVVAPCAIVYKVNHIGDPVDITNIPDAIIENALSSVSLFNDGHVLNINVNTNALANSISRVSVYNGTGQVVYNKELRLETGTTILDIPSTISKGFYVVTITYGEFQYRKKIILQ